MSRPVDERDQPEIAEAEQRYAVDSIIGRGGMGEVHAAEDLRLRRPVALKVLLAALAGQSEAVDRFLREACVTAALEHPSIVPVHDLGHLVDGRPFFAMKDLRPLDGRGADALTLKHAITQVHAATRDGRWEPAPSGWTFHRLVDALYRASEALAYAHARGVVHCDIKPGNMVLGAYGEVLVIDWGLARVTGPLAEQLPALPDREGAVRGTPAYMAPEQARGETGRIGPATDVYALGAALYEILCGRPPYQGTNSRAIVRQVIAGPPEPPGHVLLEPLVGATMGITLANMDSSEDDLTRSVLVPAELQAICLKAMGREPEERFADASGFAAELLTWLEGSRRREHAEKLVAAADALLPELAALSTQQEDLRREAAEILSRTEPWMPIQKKLPAWQRQDEAARIGHRIGVMKVEYTQLLQAAMSLAPDLLEIRDRLADHYRREHAEAEARGDQGAATQAEVLLRSHDTGRHSRYLRGDGALTLITDPPGARVQLIPLVLQNRRLVAGAVRELGRTPLHEVSLPIGSYLLRVRAPGCTEAVYPVAIRRLEHWHACPPGRTTPSTLSLPPSGALGDQDRLVPEGWFQCGGDPEAPGAGPRCRVWLPSFVMRTHPVTNAEYIRFLDALVEAGREDEALAAMPRERAGSADVAGAQIYGRDGDGRFLLKPDADNDMWEMDWPVLQIDWHGAMAYARWEADRTGQPWRLPRELEWEKAARGVDGRLFPWGDHFDPTWAATRESFSQRPLPASISAWPDDISPYGVFGLAGNSRDWCLDPWRPGGPLIEGDSLPPLPAVGGEGPRVIRGGNWSGGVHPARAASRDADVPSLRRPYLGFRLARSI